METKTSSPEVEATSKKTLPRERAPLAGREVEAAAVKAELAKVLAKVALDQDSIADALTNPRRPGLFSAALPRHLEFLAEAAIDALGMLRRLHDAHGEQLPHCLRRDRPLPTAGSVESELLDICGGLTEDEAESVCRAARAARLAADKARETAARSNPESCPKCGGPTWPVRLDENSRKRTADARRCHRCSEVTPDADAKVIPLFREERPS